MKKKRNIFGYCSIAAALTSVAFFFSPIEAEKAALVIGFSSFPGIGFALGSKEQRYVLIGTILNTAMLGMAYLLWIGAEFSKQ